MDSVSTAHGPCLPVRQEIRCTVGLEDVHSAHHICLKIHNLQGSEFYMFSESVQRNGQISVAIFTHQTGRQLTVRAVFRYGSGAAGDYSQFPQCLDAIRQRRVSAEQRGQSAAAKPRFYDT